MGRAHVSWEGCTEVDGGKLGGRGETRRMSLAEREESGNIQVPFKGRLPNNTEERLHAED